MSDQKSFPLQDKSTRKETGRELVLFNDEVNTFDFVVECLMDICRHEPEQAEQCALIAHFKGKCTVKTGHINELTPMHNALLNRGLSTTIS